MQGIKSTVCPRWVEDMQAGRAHDPDCPICQGRGRRRLTFDRDEGGGKRVCPVCKGYRPKKSPTTKFLNQDCFRCRGEGFIFVGRLEVNPAGICSTVHVGGRYAGDLVAMVVDNCVSGWFDDNHHYWLGRIVTTEYFYNGTQPMKAKRLRVSLSFFEKNLRRAYVGIDNALFEEMPKG